MQQDEKLKQINLTDMLQKTILVHTGLSATEMLVLRAIVSHIHIDISEGYYSFPSSMLLMQETGLSESSLTRSRKVLEKNEWVKIVSGSGAKRNNTYHINAKKIVDVHNMWRNHLTAKPVCAFSAIGKDAVLSFARKESKPDSRKINTSGLVQNKYVVEDFLDEPF